MINRCNTGFLVFKLITNVLVNWFILGRPSVCSQREEIQLANFLWAKKYKHFAETLQVSGDRRASLRMSKYTLSFVISFYHHREL